MLVSTLMTDDRYNNQFIDTDMMLLTVTTIGSLTQTMQLTLLTDTTISSLIQTWQMTYAMLK